MTQPWATTLVSLDAGEFDLGLTLGCGQVFHWTPLGAGYAGVIGEKPVYAEQRGRKLLVTPAAAEVAGLYFALDHPLAKIYESFPNDPAMAAALEYCRGMRIVRQPLWECVATFITSSMKQVAHIAQISHTLRRRFGKRIKTEGLELFAYPDATVLASLHEDDLRACSLGYRAALLLAAARKVSAGEVDLDAIAGLDDDTAREALCELPGVGVKVANCALLFAYERLRAFPIDVWIERVLRETYFVKKRQITPQKLREFSEGYFGRFGGYAQQYLFHHARSTRGRGQVKERSAAATEATQRLTRTKNANA